MRFEPVYVPVDDEAALSLHDDPSAPFDRVAVVGLWEKAQTTRKRWPEVAVVGPLRTKAGIDLLVRNLLANPQIDVLVVDGPTGGPVGEDTRNALARLWGGLYGSQPAERFELLAEDLQTTGPEGVWEYVTRTLESVRLVWIERGEDPDGVRQALDVALLRTALRPQGRRVLKLSPPTPKASAPAPHGDPGERVAGETLGDVYPLALHRAMRFGREVPTQYGSTRELWNLVSVIRDPKAALWEIRQAGLPGVELGSLEHLLHQRNNVMHRDDCVECNTPHPVLGISTMAVQRYFEESLVGAAPPEGQTYSYGSRMAGAGPNPVEEALRGGMETIDHVGVKLAYEILANTARRVDQIEEVRKLLGSSPGTRAAFLTPWRPEEDAGKESGRPCLTGVTFRAVPNEGRKQIEAMQTDNAEARFLQFALDTTGRGGPTHTLHLTVAFRSHDLAQAWALNLAGCCLWLVRLAGELGMAVGTLTCLSGSAHVYDRDWKKAEDVIGKTRWPPIRWDQRSSWRIEKVEDPWVIEVGDESEYKGAVQKIVKIEAREGLDYLVETTDAKGKLQSWFGRGALVGLGFHRAKAKPRLRATAFKPGPGSDGQVIAVLEAPTAGALRLQIERSGLVTEIGAALYLGTEIARVTQDLK